MHIVIDLLLLGVLVACFVVGYRRGFIEVIAKLVKFLGSFFFAFKFAKNASISIFQPMLQKPITKSFSEFLTEKCGELTPTNLEEELPFALRMIAKLFDLDLDAIASSAAANVADELALTFTEPVVAFVSVIISFFAVLLVSFAVLSVVLFIINKIFSVGALGILNQIVGAVMMTSLAVIGCSLVVSLISWIAGPEFAFGGPLFRFFNTYSPLDALLF